MTEKLEDKEVVTFEELLMSQVVHQEALTRLLIEKGIFTKEEFLEMVKVVDREMNILSIPVHKGKPVKIGLLKDQIKKAGLTEEEFLRFL